MDLRSSGDEAGSAEEMPARRCLGSEDRPAALTALDGHGAAAQSGVMRFLWALRGPAGAPGGGGLAGASRAAGVGPVSWRQAPAAGHGPSGPELRVGRPAGAGAATSALHYN